MHIAQNGINAYSYHRHAACQCYCKCFVHLVCLSICVLDSVVQAVLCDVCVCMCDCCIPIIRVVQSLQWSLNLLMTNTLMTFEPSITCTWFSRAPLKTLCACAKGTNCATSPAQQSTVIEIDMSWRTFKFFESEDVKDPENTNAFNLLLRRPVSSCSNRMIYLIEAHCWIAP